jgi:hypothetical protein
MRRFDFRVLWGVLLLIGGVVALLQNFGYLGNALAYIWGFVLGAAGLSFIFTFLTNRVHWWALIPGLTLSSIAFLILLEQIVPAAAGAWGGVLVLGGIGLSFWAIYFVNRTMWWAVIPGGVLLTLALVAGLDNNTQGLETGGIFFMGLGATFAVVGLLPTPHGRMRWAFIPAGIMIFMGVLIFGAAENLINYVWPAVLIVAGLFLVYRAFRPRQTQ